MLDQAHEQPAITLTVGDPARLALFYQRAFGCSAESTSPRDRGEVVLLRGYGASEPILELRRTAPADRAASSGAQEPARALPIVFDAEALGLTAALVLVAGGRLVGGDASVLRPGGTPPGPIRAADPLGNIVTLRAAQETAPLTDAVPAHRAYSPAPGGKEQRRARVADWLTRLVPSRDPLPAVGSRQPGDLYTLAQCYDSSARNVAAGIASAATALWPEANVEAMTGPWAEETSAECRRAVSKQLPLALVDVLIQCPLIDALLARVVVLAAGLRHPKNVVAEIGRLRRNATDRSQTYRDFVDDARFTTRRAPRFPPGG